MNYYIQGNKERADEIKAAFEAKGFIPRIAPMYYGIESVLFFTGTEDYIYETSSPWVMDIIKTHPDYQELELPVVPKYKKGDWIACDADSFTLSIKSLKDGNYYFHQGASLPIKDIDEHYHLWTIKDAKDGDILSAKIDGDNYILIFKQIKDGWVETYGHYYITIDKFCVPSQLFCRDYQGTLYPATPKQRTLFFKKMQEAGYQWYAGKKDLKKIQSHYDINNFYAGMPVLVRIDNSLNWSYALFSHYNKGWAYPFSVACCCSVKQCIPYNNDTKHLLGTTDPCDEQYINW